MPSVRGGALPEAFGLVSAPDLVLDPTASLDGAAGFELEAGEPGDGEVPGTAAFPAGSAAPAKEKPERNGLLEALVLALVALVLALTLKTYVAEAYEIKGRSMEPTFRSGQRVVVLKAFYGIHRGDIVVFTSTEDSTKDLIKRVVGMPGETVRVAGGRVYIDGKPIAEAYARHDIRDLYEAEKQERIPPDHYYVLGDNRPDSHDSRYFESIPASSVRGKVILRWWPFQDISSF